MNNKIRYRWLKISEVKIVWSMWSNTNSRYVLWTVTSIVGRCCSLGVCVLLNCMFNICFGVIFWEYRNLRCAIEWENGSCKWWLNKCQKTFTVLCSFKPISVTMPYLTSAWPWHYVVLFYCKCDVQWLFPIVSCGLLRSILCCIFQLSTGAYKRTCWSFHLY